MKPIYMVTILLVTSCSNNFFTTKSPETDPLLIKEIPIKISNEYKDEIATGEKNIITSHDSVAMYDSIYLIPKSVSVQEGISGHRWLSLRVGDQKFCYRGNGFPGPGVHDGDQFALQGVYSDISKPCYKKDYEVVKTRKVKISKGDEIASSLHGNVCIHFCEKTSAYFSLRALNDSKI